MKNGIVTEYREFCDRLGESYGTEEYSSVVESYNAFAKSVISNRNKDRDHEYVARSMILDYIDSWAEADEGLANLLKQDPILGLINEYGKDDEKSFLEEMMGA